jgi:hypothetical protein
LVLIKTVELLARNYDEQCNHQKAIEEFEELISLRKKSKHNEVEQIDNIKSYNDLQIVQLHCAWISSSMKLIPQILLWPFDGYLVRHKLIYSTLSTASNRTLHDIH